MSEKFLHYLLASLLILVIFLIIHVLHFRLLKPEIVLKACVIDVILSCLSGFIIYAFLLKNDLFVSFSAMVTMLLGLALYAVLVPTMVDRSLSVYMLVYLQEEFQSYDLVINIVYFHGIDELSFVSSSVLLKMRQLFLIKCIENHYSKGFSILFWIVKLSHYYPKSLEVTSISVTKP